MTIGDTAECVLEVYVAVSVKERIDGRVELELTLGDKAECVLEVFVGVSVKKRIDGRVEQ